MTALAHRESGLDRRSTVVVAALALVTLTLVVLSVGTGYYEMSPGEVLVAARGRGRGGPRRRLPALAVAAPPGLTAHVSRVSCTETSKVD